MAPRNGKTSKPKHTSSPERVEAVLALLGEHYPEAHCSLDFHDPLQLLISTILSAQCTDERVNQVTPDLFRKYPSAKAFAAAPIEQLETDVKSTGFYRNKAKNIKGCCSILADRFNGEVPAHMEILVQLPGIGRKTANVVLGNAFGIPGIVVDTHVGRVAQRLGLTFNTEPEKVEQDLMDLIPKDRWILFSHQLIQHGRRICQARKPKCGICPLRLHCDYVAAHPVA
jgi:endonuclease-3